MHRVESSPCELAASVDLPRWSVILLAPWLTLGAAEVLTEQGERRRAGVGVVGVVGKWTEETRDGDAVIVGDGPAAGETTSAAVSAAATTLFGAPDTAFVANATSASAFSLAVIRTSARSARERSGRSSSSYRERATRRPGWCST